jgi:hypothetical protein
MPLVAKGEGISLNEVWPLRMLDAVGNMVGDATTLPGDVLTGKQPIDDPSITPRALNFGALVSPMNPGVRAGDRAIPGVGLAGRKGPPTREMLDDAADTGFDAFRKSGIAFEGEGVGQYANALRKWLNKEGFLDTDAPSTFKVLAMLENPKAGAQLSAQGFHSVRKALGRVAGNYSPNKSEDRAAATIAIRALDGYLNKLPDESVVAGTPAVLSSAREAFTNARGNYAAARRSETVTGVEEAADLKASAANSGQNIDNALRQRLANNLLDPKKRRGFSEEELGLMRQAVEGTVPKNAARHLSNLLGGGGGLGQLAATTAGGIGGLAAGDGGLSALGGAVGLPAVGHALKAGENALARREITNLDEAVRSRSPLANEGGGVTLPTSAAGREALLKALLAYYEQNPNSL